MNILSIIKGKLFGISKFIIGFLLMTVVILKMALDKAKREKVEQENEDLKATSELSKDVTAAIVEGTANEQNTSNPRNHKFGDNS